MNSNSKNDGFTLVEIAVVMIIAGLVIFALVESYLRWNDLLRTTRTKENIAIVTDALSAYTSRNYRVPCPANPANAGPEPFGTEIGSGADGANIGSCDNVPGGEAEGIVPFASLGIDADTVRDGWGNFFTYQVSPVFTQNMDVVPTVAPTAPAVQVHAKCRTLDWIEGAVPDGAGVLQGGRNVAIQKARFCCVRSRNDETRILSTPAPLNTPSLIFTPDPAAWYNRVNMVADPNFNDPSNPVAAAGAQPYYNDVIYGGGFGGTVFGHTDMPALAIISHGKNETGAFLANGTANRKVGFAGTSEQANFSATNQNVYDLPHDSSDDLTYYDDIVFWQTQSSLLARLRRDTCSLP